MTIEQLNQIKSQYEDIVKVRKIVAEEGEKLAKKTGYRKQVLVCGGTGCNSSGSKKVIEALEDELKLQGIENEVLVVKTGCFGLCALGPIMIVYPDGAFYAQATPESVRRVVKEHLKEGNIAKDLLYQETVHSDGSIISLHETNFYKKQLRIALANCGVIDPENINEYIATEGYQALAKYNGIANPRLIHVGQEIIIPPQGNVTASAPKPEIAPNPQAVAQTQFIEHTVRKGETLDAIAKRFHVVGGYRAIVNANNMRNPNALTVGMKLRIPTN